MRVLNVSFPTLLLLYSHSIPSPSSVCVWPNRGLSARKPLLRCPRSGKGMTSISALMHFLAATSWKESKEVLAPGPSTLATRATCNSRHANLLPTTPTHPPTPPLPFSASVADRCFSRVRRDPFRVGACRGLPLFRKGLLSIQTWRFKRAPGYRVPLVDEGDSGSTQLYSSGSRSVDSTQSGPEIPGGMRTEKVCRIGWIGNA